MKKYHTIIYCTTCFKEMEVRNDYIKKHSRICTSCQKKGNTHALTHGDYKERLYKIWGSLFHRKYRINPIVCDEWHSYDTFKIWALNNGYSKNLTIDRIDPKGGYNVHNCKWISLAMNSGKDKIIWNDEQKMRVFCERKALNITQRQYAKLKNVSRSTVIRAEKFTKGKISE